jgi:hypothetical protein
MIEQAVEQLFEQAEAILQGGDQRLTGYEGQLEIPLLLRIARENGNTLFTFRSYYKALSDRLIDFVDRTGYEPLFNVKAPAEHKMRGIVRDVLGRPVNVKKINGVPYFELPDGVRNNWHPSWIEDGGIDWDAVRQYWLLRADICKNRTCRGQKVRTDVHVWYVMKPSIGATLLYAPNQDNPYISLEVVANDPSGVQALRTETLSMMDHLLKPKE